jgi:hypothetical protein
MRDKRRDTGEIREENGSMEDWQRAKVGISMKDKRRGTTEIRQRMVQ